MKYVKFFPILMLMFLLINEIEFLDACLFGCKGASDRHESKEQRSRQPQQVEQSQTQRSSPGNKSDQESGPDAGDLYPPPPQRDLYTPRHKDDLYAANYFRSEDGNRQQN
ncbi:hypothetical protein Mgra_00007625 [Meloidogyne graminicola]|uniref:Secreted protein n=1 Tax=Meloidogyne graminicola TaxID=189291 RepID=A0A8S9ZI26_9BILA|nr:hypothetical protein Mgra_00007625 [Meloidogyne graminicola]